MRRHLYSAGTSLHTLPLVRLPPKNLESTLPSSRIHSSLLPCIRLALLPKASIDIFITVLEADAPLEGVVALAVTAASAALASAGVELWALCVGAVVAISSEEGGEGEEREGTPQREPANSVSSRDFLVDPTRSEAAGILSPSSPPSPPSLVSMISMPALGSVVSFDVSARGNNGAGAKGGIDLETLDAAVTILTASAAQIHKLVAEALQESATSLLPSRIA